MRWFIFNFKQLISGRKIIGCKWVNWKLNTMFLEHSRCPINMVNRSIIAAAVLRLLPHISWEALHRLKRAQMCFFHEVFISRKLANKLQNEQGSSQFIKHTYIQLKGNLSLHFEIVSWEELSFQPLWFFLELYHVSNTFKLGSVLSLIHLHS